VIKSVMAIHKNDSTFHVAEEGGNSKTIGKKLFSLCLTLISLCLKANAEMVPKIPSCHYMLLM